MEFGFNQFLKDQAFTIGLEMASTDFEQQSVCVQLATLYTSRAGQRMVRVQTAKLGCDNKPATVFNNTNQFAFIAYLCRKYAQ